MRLPNWLLLSLPVVHGLVQGTLPPLRQGGTLPPAPFGAAARLPGPAWLRSLPTLTRSAAVTPGRLIVVRHGESTWNLENRFTGWADVPLTRRGELDAARAADLILAEPGFRADVTYVSQLCRSVDTADIILERMQAAGRPAIPCLRRWRLNERHYGALTGIPKREARGKSVGGLVLDSATLRNYRTSVEGKPPPMDPAHAYYTRRATAAATPTRIAMLPLAPAVAALGRLLAFSVACFQWQVLRRACWRALLCYRSARRRLWGAAAPAGAQPSVLELPGWMAADEPLAPWDIPLTESLGDTCRRVEVFWWDELRPTLLAGNDVLLIGHANGLRALLRAIQGLPASDLTRLALPNSIPLVYSFDETGKPKEASAAERRRGAVVPPLQGYYLGDVATEFNTADSDADGALRSGELLAAGYCADEDECGFIMTSADDNGDGKVDFKEYMAWAGSTGGEAARERARLFARERGERLLSSDASAQ